MIQHILRSFSVNRRRCITAFQVLLAGIFFFAGIKMLNHLYWQEEDWERILFHDFYEQTENIDHIYLGSSHVFCALNPEILDQRNGKNNFNMATSGQSLMGSYYLLKEADKHNKIEKVYLELYYTCSTGGQGDYRSKESVQISWRTTDYMKTSLLKLDALLHMNPKEYYIDALLPFVRYREHLLEDSWIQGRIDYKRTGNYKNYIYIDGMTEYREKGYYATAREFTNLLCARERGPKEMYLTEDAEKYLRKIIEYCQKKEIPIVLYSNPMYEILPMSTENYDSYVDEIRKTAAEYSVPYYDFNMAKEEYLPVQTPEYFMDAGHLNSRGAELYTDFFHRVVSARPEENAEYFYQSYQEKLETAEPKVYGLYNYIVGEAEQQLNATPDKNIKMVIAATQSDEIECQIFLTPVDGERYMLQDFSTNKEFNISSQEHGTCEVIWRNIEKKDEAETIEIQY